VLLPVLLWGMFAGWIAHLLVAAADQGFLWRAARDSNPQPPHP
jgi:uncharacterized membrane protein YeaQ/YmgE (transglycosylase-associated protein family)